MAPAERDQPPCGPDPDGPADSLTSHNVGRALEGDRESLGWVVTRFSPLLRAQATWRLGALQRQFPVDDIVAEAWLVALRRRSDLVRDVGRSTPRMLAFLGTTVVNIANRRIEEFLQQGERYVPQAPASDADGILLELSDTVTSAMTRAGRNETAAALEAALEQLSATDREVIILRVIEGLSNKEAAHHTGEALNTVSQRYRRALARLREALPESFLADLDPE